MINCTNSILFAPINKYRKIPEKLIYSRSFIFAGKLFEHCKVFSTKTGKFGGFMEMRPEAITLNNFRKPSVYVSYLYSNVSGHGFGTSLLNYARSFSKEVGCEGRIFLDADSSLNPYYAPHIFYRKYGMNTGKREIDKKLDKFIKKRKNATNKDFSIERMFYPPIAYSKEKNIFKRLFTKMRDIFC